MNCLLSRVHFGLSLLLIFHFFLFAFHVQTVCIFLRNNALSCQFCQFPVPTMCIFLCFNASSCQFCQFPVPTVCIFLCFNASSCQFCQFPVPTVYIFLCYNASSCQSHSLHLSVSLISAQPIFEASPFFML
ncbi:hypothetical protein CLIB1423_04S00254 [[Candida] railenensis]|uniref:Uncharacterized protein n=1 Tax=[Candida] railenensis TaxID=45579 RepID=A0A9P0QMP1_9ASCO|nr:hypothetical protein CLIB1423_04S00254 [[Candida] railenensis]